MDNSPFEIVKEQGLQFKITITPIYLVSLGAAVTYLHCVRSQKSLGPSSAAFYRFERENKVRVGKISMTAPNMSIEFLMHSQECHR